MQEDLFSYSALDNNSSLFDIFKQNEILQKKDIAFTIEHKFSVFSVSFALPFFGIPPHMTKFISDVYVFVVRYISNS